MTIIKNHIQRLVLYSLLLGHSMTIASILSGTAIKTTHGLAQVENICCGDELIAYSYDSNVTTCVVKKISKTMTDSIIEIVTDKGVIKAVPGQLFHDPITKKWIAASAITKDNYFLDAQLKCVHCLDSRIVSVESMSVYHISTTFPHTFFVTEQEILTHNFFPVVLGASWIFGLGSIEFTGFNLAMIIAGTSIGIKLLKSKKHKNKNSEIVVKPYVQKEGCGGPNPDDDDNDDDKNQKKRKLNIVSKAEFFRKVKKDYEHWQNGMYKRKRGAKGIENAEYLKWDHLHGDVEAYNKNEIPLGSIDPDTLKIYKSVSKHRKML